MYGDVIKAAIGRISHVAADSQTKPPFNLAYDSTSATVHDHHRHLLLLLRPKADRHFTVLLRVEG